MKVKYNLSQFMAAADYLSKYNDYIGKSPLEWLAKMDRELQDAVRAGSYSVSVGGFCIQTHRWGLDTDDLVAEIWVEPTLWSKDTEYHFTVMDVKVNTDGPGTAEATSVKAA